MISLKLLSKNSNRWLTWLAFAAICITGIGVHTISQFGQDKPKSSQPVETAPPKVAALGRLEPEAEVINLSAPMDLNGDRIAQILVKEGDRVAAAQVVAILSSHNKLQSALQQAEKQLSVSQANLSKVKAGAKLGEIQAQQATIERLLAEKDTEIEAQKATISRLQAEQATETEAQKATIAEMKAQLDNAQMDYNRHQTLYQEGAISTSLRDTKRLAMQTTQQQLKAAQANLKRIQESRTQQLSEARANLRRIQASREQEIKEAKATLNKIAEVRPVDVQAANTEVEQAKAAVNRAKTELEQAYIKAPMAGQILKIRTRTGEKIAEEGIVDLAQNDQMVAVAEIYQTDIGKVKPGQKAVVTGQAINGELRGVVSQIGLQVNRQNVFSNQPGENLDKRVVEVKIRLNPEDSKKVAGLTNLQVQTAIEL